jgi:hypothetical protein
MQHVVVSYIIPMARFHAPARHSSRLGQRFQVALGAAAALAAISLSPGSAQAYVVTVGGVQYDVTTFTGSYNNNSSKFATAANGGVMPWWGDTNLARGFADAVRLNLGAVNGVYGPQFGWSLTPVVNVWQWRTQPTSLNSTTRGASTTLTYAQATLYTAPAPGPLPLFGAAAAFGFSRKLRKRIKLAPGALASSQPLA